MRKTLFVSAVLFMAIAGSSCVSLPPLSQYKSRHGVDIRGNDVQKEQVEKIDEILDVFSSCPKIIKSIFSISCRDDSEHFESDKTAGHCHWNRHICVKSNYFTDPYLLWHEIGHTYTHHLPRSFDDSWLRISGEVYGKNMPKDAVFPTRGVLTDYGAIDYQEDIAEWVQHIYFFLTDRFSAILALKISGELNNPLSIYHKKLELLYRYGFISSENYEKILH